MKERPKDGRNTYGDISHLSPVVSRIRRGHTIRILVYTHTPRPSRPAGRPADVYIHILFVINTSRRAVGLRSVCVYDSQLDAARRSLSPALFLSFRQYNIIRYCILLTFFFIALLIPPASAFLSLVRALVLRKTPKTPIFYPYSIFVFRHAAAVVVVVVIM